MTQRVTRRYFDGNPFLPDLFAALHSSSLSENNSTGCPALRSMHRRSSDVNHPATHKHTALIFSFTFLPPLHSPSWIISQMFQFRGMWHLRHPENFRRKKLYVWNLVTIVYCRFSLNEKWVMSPSDLRFIDKIRSISGTAFATHQISFLIRHLKHII